MHRLNLKKVRLIATSLSEVVDPNTRLKDQIANAVLDYAQEYGGYGTVKQFTVQDQNVILSLYKKEHEKWKNKNFTQGACT